MTYLYQRNENLATHLLIRTTQCSKQSGYCICVAYTSQSFHSLQSDSRDGVTQCLNEFMRCGAATNDAKDMGGGFAYCRSFIAHRRHKNPFRANGINT